MYADDVCVIVPVYNEEPAVGGTLAGLLDTFAHVVCVDDGSGDGSGEIARAAGATVLRHAVNLGQGAALQTGFDYALRRTRADHVVTFDADGQHDVEDAVRMLEVARETGVDVVLASRFTGQTEAMPFSRRMVLQAGVRFTRATAHLEITDTHNGLRVLSRRALTRIRLDLPRMAYASELLESIVPNGLTYTEVPTTVSYTDYSRAKGQRNSNAFNILFDLALRRLRSAR
ncbi:MAG: glycosyltransferase family 2 protein [Nocardioidaceae bacterium]|nr:glycosyltransferase family 2 protein [Nocardioidaceae bacterium]